MQSFYYFSVNNELSLLLPMGSAVELSLHRHTVPQSVARYRASQRSDDAPDVVAFWQELVCPSGKPHLARLARKTPWHLSADSNSPNADSIDDAARPPVSQLGGR